MSSVDKSELALSGLPVQLFRIDDPQNSSLITPHDWVDDVLFSPATHSLFTGGVQQIQIWKRNESHSDASFEVPRRVHCQAVSPDGRWLVAGGGDRYQDDHGGYLLFVDLTSGKQWKVAQKGGTIVDIGFIDSDRFLAVTLAGHGSIDVWSLKQRKIKISTPCSQGNCVAISPTGVVAAIGMNIGKIAFHRTDSLEELYTLPATGPSVRDLEFLADGKTLAVADETPDVKLWNLQSKQLVGALPGHQAKVIELCTADEPPRLFSLSTDGEIRIWRGGP